MNDEITRVQLNNGLLVLLKEIHTAPLVSVWMWYRVGSRDEPPGMTGASHWVEHMMFKGTPKFPSGVLDKMIARQGGYWNAMTFLDWTTYFATLPAGGENIILELEADRLTNSIFDSTEIESERNVIISERQGNENNPLFLLIEAVQRASFEEHSYGHEVIGNLADLQSMTRDQLHRHYSSYYIPNNAVLSIAGDFDPNEMLDQIRFLFEDIPAGKLPPGAAKSEPPQEKEHRVKVEGPGETTFIQLAYHVPPTTSRDFYSFTVLDSLLTGPSNLNLFGGGISNTTSLLYQRLVEKELVVSMAGSLQATIDPFIYSILLTVHPRRKAKEVLVALDKEISDMQQTPPQQNALTRAVKQARALFAYGSESISNQAFWLGFSEMFDHYEWFEQYIERLSAVTPQDVQHVARQYLRSANRVVGIYQPDGKRGIL